MGDYQRVHFNFLMAKRSLERLWLPYIKDDIKMIQQLNNINQTAVDIMRSQNYYFTTINSQLNSLENLIKKNLKENTKAKKESKYRLKDLKQPFKPSKSLPVKLKFKFTHFQDLNNKKVEEELKLKEDANLKENEVQIVTQTPKIFFKIEDKCQEAANNNYKNHSLIQNFINTKPSNLKFRSDCFRKRNKTHFHNYLFKHLTNLISDKSKPIYRLAKEFNTNIRFDFNNMIFKFTIRDLFSYKPLDYNDQLNSQKTNEVINSLYDAKALYFLNRTYLDVFIEYMYSSSIREELRVIAKNDGEEYIKYFKYFLENYISFYSSDQN